MLLSVEEKSSVGNRQGIIARTLFLSALLLSGCAPLVDLDQAGTAQSLVFPPGHTLGQTFVARHGGLHGVAFWLDPASGATGDLTLHLRAAPDADEDLATATRAVDAVSSPGFQRFTFDPLRDSHGEYYYAFITFEGEGEIQVGAASGDAYIDGALYQDHEPQDAQMAFRLVYDPIWTAVELAGAAVRGAGMVGVALLLYAVPGWALLAWLWPQAEITWAERLALAVGISLALYPLLLLWTDVVGVHLGALYAWIPVVGGLVALSWCYRDWRPRKGRDALKRWVRSNAFWPDATLLVVLALVFGVRLLVVRTLDAPMWGDSYQHAVISRLIMDRGGLFHSWEPYAPYQSLTVHFGFHTLVALFSWLTGTGSVQATLWVGQLVNGLAALTVLPLATRLAKDSRWSGPVAVLVAGLLSTMPAFYVNWGRFPQLAGQAILPVAIWTTWRALERKSWLWLGVAGGVLCGMTLTYYRMPFYYAVFVFILLVTYAIKAWRNKDVAWWGYVGRLAGIALILLVLLAPWMARVAGGYLTDAVAAGMSQNTPLARVMADYAIWRDIIFYVPGFLLVLAVAALVWAMVDGHPFVVGVGVWILGMASLVAGRLIRLPGANMMQNFAVLIALYIPVSVLIGWAGGRLAQFFSQLRGRVSRAVLSIALIIAALWGTKLRLGDVDLSYALVTRPDMHAMAWIKETVHPSAKFLVEGFRIYSGRTAVGADAGWWIPLLAHRQNTMPPQYALFNEQPMTPGYNKTVVDWIAFLEEVPLSSPDVLPRLCAAKITHVYVGQGQGNVGAGAVQLFDPQTLQDSPFLEPIYHENRVWVFDVDASHCDK